MNENLTEWNGVSLLDANKPLNEFDRDKVAMFIEELSDFETAEFRRILLIRVAATLRNFDNRRKK